MKKNYVPQPVDTVDVQLPEELSELVEQMAKYGHRVVWSRGDLGRGTE